MWLIEPIQNSGSEHWLLLARYFLFAGFCVKGITRSLKFTMHNHNLKINEDQLEKCTIQD